MKSCLECVPCFARQTFDAVRFATDDIALREVILREVLAEVAGMSWDQSPPHVSTVIHRIVRERTGNTDPYKQVKERSTRTALDFCARHLDDLLAGRDPFEAAARLAIAGNIIDFVFKQVISDDYIEHSLREAMDAPLWGSSIDDLRTAVDNAQTILYLADNAGESVFDKLFIQQIGVEKVTYAVRGGPCLNDVTLEDARQAGITDIINVIDTGLAAPAAILEQCSPEFIDRFNSVDLVISKGLGNYEALSDVDRPIAFLFKAKCPVTADYVGCELGRMVVLMR